MIAKFKNQVVEVWEVSKTGRVLTGWSRLLKENILFGMTIVYGFAWPHASSNLLSGLTGSAGRLCGWFWRSCYG